MARSTQNKKTNGNDRTFSTQQSLDSYIWGICDILRRSNCASALQYIPELTWILFLRILDENETRDAEQMTAVGASFQPSLASPYRWQDWAAPDGWKRLELQNSGISNAFLAFVNSQLIPYLQKLKDQPNATPRQKVISQIMSGVERTRIDTEFNLYEVLDRVHAISQANIDTTHMFPISQAYEGLLLKLGEKNNDGGQFFTPRIVTKVMARVVKPRIGKTFYDPGCGTAGMMIEGDAYMRAERGEDLTGEDLDVLKHRTFYGREKENLIYPIALANMVLHDIDQPNIWHGNTLTMQEVYGGLFEGAPTLYDYIMTNPPFGGKEGKEAQQRFPFQTGATQILFLQHVIDSLKAGGTCGIVLDEGALFRTNETAFVQTKRKLLDDCNLFCIVSLPGGVFSAVGAGVKTNLLFFIKGEPTKKIWYYDLSDVKVTKKAQLTEEHFADFFARLDDRSDSEHSWTIDIVAKRAAAKREADPLRAQAAKPAAQAVRLREQFKELAKVQPLDERRLSALKEDGARLDAEARDLNAKAQAIEDAVYDLKAVNPNAKSEGDVRTPAELIAFIEGKGREVAQALAMLKGEAGMQIPEDFPYREQMIILAKHQQQHDYLVRYQFVVVSGDDRHDLIVHALNRTGDDDEDPNPILVQPNYDLLVLGEKRGLILIMEGSIEREHGVFVLTLGAAQASPLVQVMNVSGGNVINAQRDVNVGRD
ncbi:partial putative type I restriction enzymeP M protein, partial [Anaerolineales bacterium]